MANIGVNMVQLEKDFKRILGRAEAVALVDVKDLIKDTYMDVVGQPPSPVYTGYYASNHRILIRKSGGQFGRGGGVAKLAPASKAKNAPRGTYEGNIASAVAEELAKIRSVEIGDIITITTRVPYADAVEQKHGNYSNAEALLGFKG